MLYLSCCVGAGSVLPVHDSASPVIRIKMLAFNVSAKHQFIHICTCHAICTILYFQHDLSCPEVSSKTPTFVTTNW